MTVDNIDVYPIVGCEKYPEVREAGYLVCEHVGNPGDVEFFEPATETSMGVISCKSCPEETDPKRQIYHFSVSCASCLRSAGFIPITVQ